MNKISENYLLALNVLKASIEQDLPLSVVLTKNNLSQKFISNISKEISEDKGINKEFLEEFISFKKEIFDKKIMKARNTSSTIQTPEYWDSKLNKLILVTKLYLEDNNTDSITKLCSSNGLPATFFKNNKDIANSNFCKKYANPEKISELKTLLSSYNEIKGMAQTTTKTNSVKVDLNDAFDDRNRVWETRDSNNKIIEYNYHILRKDRPALVGKFTREDMEKVHSLYPYVSVNTLSLEFSNIDSFEMKKIIRAFNITKDVIFPKHIIEEQNTPEEFALLAKEKSAYKKFSESRNTFAESLLKKTQEELFNKDLEISNIKNIITEVASKFKPLEITNENKKSSSNKRGFVVFGDIHFGKKYIEQDMPIRGNTSDILMDRIVQITNYAIKQIKNNNLTNISLYCLGDIIESAQSNGMHDNHLSQMDLIGAEQITFAVNAMEYMVKNIYQNLPKNGVLDFHCIGGNHDRFGDKRGDDKIRTASLIAYNFVDKLFENSKNINVNIYRNGVIQDEADSISVIAFHGDQSLMKLKASDLILAKKKGDSENYTLIMCGHWHSFKMEEGVKYAKMTVGSVCSPDDFIQNDLGKGAVPSFVYAEKPEQGYGLDINKIILY